MRGRIAIVAAALIAGLDVSGIAQPSLVNENANVLIRTLFPSPNRNVIATAFTRDGRMVIAGGANEVSLWDTGTGQLVRRIATTGWGVAPSPDGRTLATGLGIIGGKGVALWDYGSGRLLRTLDDRTKHDVIAVAFSPDGKILAAGGRDKINLWDVSSARVLRTISGDGLFEALAFAPHGTDLASAGDETVRLWDVASGQHKHTLGNKPGRAVAFSPDGGILAVGGSGPPGAAEVVKLWNVASGTLLRALSPKSNSVFSVAFSPNGRVLAIGSYNPAIELWDVATAQLLRTLEGHRLYVGSVSFSPDGKLLLSGSNDATVKLWDITRALKP